VITITGSIAAKQVLKTQNLRAANLSPLKNNCTKSTKKRLQSLRMKSAAHVSASEMTYIVSSGALNSTHYPLLLRMSIRRNRHKNMNSAVRLCPPVERRNVRRLRF